MEFTSNCLKLFLTESSFSKLKLIKTYRKSTIAQDILTSLAKPSTENAITQHLYFSELIRILKYKICLNS